MKQKHFREKKSSKDVNFRYVYIINTLIIFFDVLANVVTYV